MPTMTKTIGDFLKYEAPHGYSREDVTVASGQTLVPVPRRRGDEPGSGSGSGSRSRRSPQARG